MADCLIQFNFWLGKAQLESLRAVYLEKKPDLPVGSRTFSAWLRDYGLAPVVEKGGYEWPPTPRGTREGQKKS